MARDLEYGRVYAGLGAIPMRIVGGRGRVHNSAIPAVRREFGPVIGLPEGRVHCIVSALVLSAIESRPADYPHRTFYFAPNTGPTARRNEAGQVTGVYSLVSI